MDGFYTVLLVVHTIIVLFLIGIVLIQRSDSDGLSGLGGGGGNQFMTGRGAANALTRTTAILAAIFMATSLILAVMVSRDNNTSLIDAIPATATETIQQPAPEAPVSQPVVPKPE